ncbi:MAG: tRNA 2-thiouridine(34) synthase MnmA [Candidatus Micrarchaeota archaeon]
MNKKIVVGMSGGVDSSVSLILLKKSGWQPVGVTLLLPHWGSCSENACCTKESINIAKSVCKKLGVKHYTINCKKNFKKTVMNYFVRELREGKTPNPCITCNRFFKFKKLLDFAKKHGIQFIATGHYAKTKKNKEKTSLLEAKDKEKNQVYGLCLLPQEWLQKIVFPLGNLKKNEVYSIAEKAGFPIFLKRKQSQDLCFVNSKELRSFIEKEVGTEKGSITNEKGEVLGKHEGHAFYTIGQHKGLNGFFLKNKNPKKNELIVTKNRCELETKTVLMRNFNFCSGKTPKRKTKVKAQVRYRQPLVDAILWPPKKGVLKIVFKKPVEAVTPGQVCAFYSGTRCLGGGYIT